MSKRSDESLPATRVYPHPHSCLPLSTEEQTASGENPWERGAKSGEEFILEKQQKREKIQKLSPSDQRSCLYKGKSYI